MKPVSIHTLVLEWYTYCSIGHFTIHKFRLPWSITSLLQLLLSFISPQHPVNTEAGWVWCELTIIWWWWQLVWKKSWSNWSSGSILGGFRRTKQGGWRLYGSGWWAERIIFLFVVPCRFSASALSLSTLEVSFFWKERSKKDLTAPENPVPI